MTNESHIYPIGKFQAPEKFDVALVDQWILSIAQLPSKLLETIETMPEPCWDLSYREGGWNARQIVHHLADSHMNGIIRMKHALTEEAPAIKPYNQDEFVMMRDAMDLDPMISWRILDGLHIRMAYLIRNMKSEDFQRTYYNPEYQKSYDMNTVVALYAWHGDHHCGQLEVIKNLIG